MDRPCLMQALESIGEQSHSPIEVVLVKASGTRHGPVPENCGPCPVRAIGSDKNLSRPAAANVGLDHALGEYIGFLDDDDLLDSNHVEGLVVLLQQHPEIRAAYAGVRFQGPDPGSAREFNEAYEPVRLRLGNYIPIHAVLFHRSLRDQCRFDEALEVYEDWDFWLQMSRHTDFLHLSKISATYRDIGNSAVNPSAMAVSSQRAAIYEKWRLRFSGEEIEELLGYSEMHFSRPLRQHAQQLQSKVQGLEVEKDRLWVHIRQLQAEIDKILQSTSWRVTTPLRWAGDVLARARQLGRNLNRLVRQQGGLAHAAGKTLKLVRQEGWQGFLWRCKRELSSDPGQLSGNDYQLWIEHYDQPGEPEIKAMHRQMRAFVRQPKISILMPVYNPNLRWLQQAIDSVLAQIYPHWELCIADDASTQPEVRQMLQGLATQDQRIKVVLRKTNGHIAAASNSALEIASGAYVALMDQDDLLAADALYHVAKALEQEDIALIYSDEDKIDEQNRRHAPYFKCDWNYDLFLSHNMICHLGVYDAAQVRALGGFNEALSGAQDYDLALRLIERISPERIRHIPRVLYHWRSHHASTASEESVKPYALEAGEKALNQHLQRRGIAGQAILQPGGHYRVRYQLPDPAPRVGLIIPTRNGLELLKTCLGSILNKSTYPNYQVLIVDNGSDDPEVLSYFDALGRDHGVRVLRDDRPFNYSALNNRAVSELDCEFVALVNNDIEVISPDWLEEMVSLAAQPGVGAVGARLWYPDDRLQHAGVIMVGGVAGHAHKGLPRGAPGYAKRAILLQSFSAVTAACLVVRRSTFLAADGLDEEHLAIAFNDIDFCLKLETLGHRNIWTPYAELYHHESASRGLETTPEKQQRFAQEVRFMQDKWGERLRLDPAYSPNLSLDREDFSLAWPPRVPPITASDA
ncbi:glycosyltransferase [Magnetovirga frankeli]|uniref:glycosyltransferase n=1 Tax=Magnetovirga frankeli TaxID=947516 RepID=UPI001AF30BEB|nr:glycosyltransferase [gamma proteobacterium SS-5]